MKQISPLEKLMDLYGGTSKIALQLGVDRQVVDQWYKNGKIPFRRGELIHQKTGGEVTRNQVWEFANKSVVLE
jgi:DNA-binding transcriptional regulator YdaS (Cro superfamily)